ncbi:rRNA maturation RNase YbeY [Gammaproteobacteria bacterium]|nr:rRNA maturation RNase YbeY [Gammaproteobacteria bacterium]MDB4277550.1 rRNA maturation RNase YbeY [Gammaproteobacteria bacterium]MDB9700389.1 rRNA maturation RNase YbeY [Gammaproteobacteria bacterium]
MSLNIIAEFPLELSRALTEQLCLLAEEILRDHQKNDFLVNLKFVDSEEMITLNKSFRHKEKDTNVLSFPAAPEAMVHSKELGDIAICIPFVELEAKTLNRTKDDHMMHITAHGILHLLGFDHINENDANLMESHEISQLKKFNIANPYLI